MPVRRLSPSEIREVTPLDVQEVQGVSGLERFTFQNLAANPDSARAYLEQRGYQVRPYGGGWRFAVRKTDGEPWRVVDPRGPDAGDLFDLVGDLFVGAASTAGAIVGSAVSPIAGTIAGSAGGAALGESIRQGTGALAGVPQNLDPSAIALQGFVGAAVPAGGAALGAAGRSIGTFARSEFGRQTGRGLAQVGAFIAGTGALGRALPREEVLLRRAAIPAETLPTVESVAKRLHKVVRSLWHSGDAKIGELEAAEGIARLAEEQGVRVDIRSALDKLARFAPEPGGEIARTTTRRTITETLAKGSREAKTETFLATGKVDLKQPVSFEAQTAARTRKEVVKELSGIGIQPEARSVREAATTRTVFETEERLRQEAAEAAISEPNLPTAAQQVLDRIMRFVGKEDLSALSPVTATRIKRQLQRIGFSRGAFENVPIGDKFTGLVADTGHQIRLATENAIEASGLGRSYANLMEIGAWKFERLKDMYEAVGRDPDQALSFVNGVYGGNFRIQALHDFERAMGLPEGGLTGAVEQARIGDVVFGPGRRGKPGLFPRLGATGVPLGVATLGLGGAVLGGPLGALVGGAMASPKAILGMTRAGVRIGRALQRIPAEAAPTLLKQLVTGAGVAGGSATGRAVASQDSPKKRKAYFTGG